MNSHISGGWAADRSIGYRKDIDGLRAVAVLMVLVFHFDLFGSRGGGFLGVDVFFVISGYLITSIVCRDIQAGEFRLSDFYVSRVRRLAPALFATLFLVMAAGLIFLFPSDLENLTKQVVAAQIYSSNIYYWRTINYFGLSAHSAYLLHTWSLAVEEQFYLIYPLGLTLAHRFGRVQAFVVVALILSFLLNLLFITTKPEATFYLLPTRAWELLIGALLAQTEGRLSLNRWADRLGAVGLFLIAGSFILLDRTYRFPGFAALMPTTGALLLLLAGKNKESLTSRGLSWGPLRYIGRISYPLYLVHWPLAVFLAQFLGETYRFGWRVAGFVGSFVLASAVYHLIEKPVRRSATAPSKLSIGSIYIGGLLASLLVCGIVIACQGLPQRFPSHAVALAAFAADRPPPMPECEHQNGTLPSAVCIIGSQSVVPTWLVYGDSHAWAARAAVELWLRRSGQSAFFMFQHSCPPIRGVHLYHDNDACFAFNESAFALLEREPNIKNVLLISIWRQPMKDLTISSDVPPTPKTSQEIFARQIKASLENMVSMNKHVFIWEPIPTATSNVPQALARIAAGRFNPDTAISERRYRREFSFFFDAENANSALISGIFSPAKVLCHEVCDIQIDGKPAFFDNNHIAASGAGFWADRLSEQIRP
ncbi:acyltransferase [Bradyrhizobium japonicum]|uniref:acyltransferase family protein n=1 Tax=Bradyrhizobium japonicum TaxID=375 RepID=UPI001BA68487|nr:acyltransferase family protein [Bradyrhizobium japonicum]MBR0995459.1 acyltransferase [Bradyrhizobium japonicum]